MSIWHPLQKGAQDSRFEVAAGGVVGVADYKKARLFTHRRQHGLEIVVQPGKPHSGERCPTREGYQPVHDKRRTRKDRVILRTEERLPQQHEQLAGAVAEHQAFLGHFQLFGQEAAQVVTASIGVAIETVESGLHSLDYLREGTPRALVRG